MDPNNTGVLVSVSTQGPGSRTRGLVPGRARLGKMAGRSLSPDELDRLQKFLAALRARGETQAQIAERSGISQQSVSRALAGVGAGYDFSRAIARAYGVSVEELLSGQPAPPTRTAPTLDRIDGYAAAEAAARAIAPRIPDAAWARVRAMSGADVRVVDAEAVLGFARLWERVLAGQVQEYPDDGDVPPPPRKR